MNSHSNLIFALVLTIGLTGCVLTPQQQAEEARQKRLYEQNLQVMLANQCDPETAQLMKQQFQSIQSVQSVNPAEQTAIRSPENQEMRLKYVEKVNDPMFQACYKMAWQNYLSQQKLHEIRQMRYRYYDDWEYGLRPFPPMFMPFW